MISFDHSMFPKILPACRPWIAEQKHSCLTPVSYGSWGTECSCQVCSHNVEANDNASYIESQTYMSPRAWARGKVGAGRRHMPLQIRCAYPEFCGPRN